jgi:hypothetical protein
LKRARELDLPTFRTVTMFTIRLSFLQRSLPFSALMTFNERSQKTL